MKFRFENIQKTEVAMARTYKITKKSAADLVCEQMKKFLTDGTWRPGQKIPTEIEMSEIFGVNRLTVRIAVQRLNTLGLLEIRVGDGTYVKSFDLNTQISELSEFYVNEDTIKNVMEYRRVIEIPCMRMAAERRTEEELERYRLLCLRFQRELEQYYAAADPQEKEKFFSQNIDSSEEINATLFEMTHNDLMIYAFSLARKPLRHHMEMNAKKRLYDLDTDKINIWSKRWYELYEALKAQDAEACMDIMSRIIG